MIGKIQPNIFREPCDHISPNNPYERFMISILERLSKMEERIDRIGKSLDAVANAIKDNDAPIIYINTSTIKPDTYRYIRDTVGTDCVLGDNSIQTVARGGFFANIDFVIKKLAHIGINVDNISVKTGLEIDKGSLLVSDNVYKLQLQ